MRFLTMSCRHITATELDEPPLIDRQGGSERGKVDKGGDSNYAIHHAWALER